MLGKQWIYQHDSAKSHTHQLTQNWRMHNFPDFIPKSPCPPNSPDLCPLDHSLWTKSANCMNWSQITIKATSIDEITRSVKRVEKENILYSVSDFTVRLRMFEKQWRRIHPLNKIYSLMQNFEHYFFVKKIFLIIGRLKTKLMKW